jgi:2-oxo-4-hydroxy-4-carboxy-5-ureidoimidazoline decarboxylase
LIGVDAINAMSEKDARIALLRCCGSHAWANGVLEHRPYQSFRTLLEKSDEVWSKLGRSDWIEAFAAHPRIGDIESLRMKFASTADWCSIEQAGIAKADEMLLRELAEANHQYEQKFGYIFIVCATGKTATEMLANLLSRLNNEPESELKVAAAEQAKITRLRLEKL